MCSDSVYFIFCNQFCYHSVQNCIFHVFLLVCLELAYSLSSCAWQISERDLSTFMISMLINKEMIGCN